MGYIFFILECVFGEVVFLPSLIYSTSLFCNIGSMDFSLGSEAPAILQLHRWGPSHPQLNLSEFREAFISPTRQLLLLLSSQREALLLPLITGEFSCFLCFALCLDLTFTHW